MVGKVDSDSALPMTQTACRRPALCNADRYDISSINKTFIIIITIIIIKCIIRPRAAITKGLL